MKYADKHNNDKDICQYSSGSYYFIAAYSDIHEREKINVSRISFLAVVVFQGVKTLSKIINNNLVTWNGKLVYDMSLAKKYM